MPTYRKLYTKVLDSADFNAMPDDFARVMWLVLPLRCDREGRGIDDPHWLKSVLFPRRRDVTIEQIEAAMCWYAERQMIERYQVNGERYFHIISWATYQTGTDREAPSYIPNPPKRSRDKVMSSSRVNQGGVKHAVSVFDPVPDTVPVPECVKKPAVEVPKSKRGTRNGWVNTFRKAPHQIRAFVAVRQRYPAKELWNEIVTAVPDETAALRKWCKSLIAYSKAGYNRNAIDGPLEWFKKGIPKKFQAVVGGNHAARQSVQTKSGNPNAGRYEHKPFDPTRPRVTPVS